MMNHKFKFFLVSFIKFNLLLLAQMIVPGAANLFLREWRTAVVFLAAAFVSYFAYLILMAPIIYFIVSMVVVIAVLHLIFSESFWGYMKH